MPGLAPPHPSPNPPQYGINVENYGQHAPHNSALSKSKAIFIDWTKNHWQSTDWMTKNYQIVQWKGAHIIQKKKSLKMLLKTVKNVSIQSTAPPIYSKTFLRFLCQFQYLDDPKVEKKIISQKALTKIFPN